MPSMRAAWPPQKHSTSASATNLVRNPRLLYPRPKRVSYAPEHLCNENCAEYRKQALDSESRAYEKRADNE